MVNPSKTKPGHKSLVARFGFSVGLFYFVLAVFPNTASIPAWAHFSPSPLETPIEPIT
jgi:hypothetical protein